MIFEVAIVHILRHEGGYVNNPADPGGETKYGIAKKFFPHLDIKNLTEDQAREIYRRDYWDANRLEEIPPFLRLSYFDCVVNQGPGAAVKLLQRAARVPDDGVFGPKTMAAVQAGGYGLLVRFLMERAMHYSSLRTFAVFGRGWMKRLMDVAVESGREIVT